LMDFSDSAVGTSFRLVSLPFAIGGGMMGGSAQGSAMDLIRFYVDSPTTGNARVPSVLAPVEALSETQASRTRVFTLAMTGMVHSINGRWFDMERVEFTVPFGDVEIWEYRNTGTEPHPMHAHGVLGQVLSRSTTAVLPPEDSGWKDTVLVNPRETVQVLMRFDSHPGVFVHHCHNLEHEDSGMMQNFEVQAPPALAIERNGGGVSLSWPESSEGWRLEASTKTVGSPWGPVAEVPIVVGQRWTVRISEPIGPRFYRLVKGRTSLHQSGTNPVRHE
ncbi:MAG: multicopper oxidase domain-containing protein, partial [Nitrospira sp.]|nr:multicopper oxidase domain-containing protein [Nitrospira sp.]